MAEPRLYFHCLKHSNPIDLQVDSSLASPLESVPPAFSLEAIDSMTLRLFRLLGLLTGEHFSLSLASALLEVDAEPAIDKLIALNLIQPIALHFYQFSHRSIRSSARQQVGLEETLAARQAARSRICQWYLERLESTSPNLSAWIEQERPHLMSAIEWMQQHQPGEGFARLVMAIAQFLEEDRMGQQLSTLALQVATDPIHKAMLWNNLGNFDLRLQNWQAAESNYQNSLAVFNQVNDRVRSTQTFVNLGILAAEQKNRSAAIVYWKNAIIQLPVGSAEHQAIQQHMFEIDPALFESAGGTRMPTNSLFQTWTDKLKRFLID